MTFIHFAQFGLTILLIIMAAGINAKLDEFTRTFVEFTESLNMVGEQIEREKEVKENGH